MIPPLVIDTTPDPRLVVVILHGRAMRAGDLAPVSYTHLTLPTNREV